MRAGLGQIPLQNQQGIKFYTNREAEAVVAKSRESFQEDVFGAIERRDFPNWKLFVEIIPEADVGKRWYDPFDLTKVWPHGDYPLIAVGLMELDRNADDYFTAAFSPFNMVPGISWSPDRMLQVRIFSCADAHRYRLGTHYEALPVNRPRCPVHNYHKDGLIRFFEATTGNPDAFYEPNSFNGPVEDPRFVEPPLRLAGDAARYNHREGNDDYRQPGDLFRLIGKEAQQRLVNNVAGAMQGVPREIVERQLGHFAKADPKYAEGVAQALGMAFRQAAE